MTRTVGHPLIVTWLRKHVPCVLQLKVGWVAGIPIGWDGRVDHGWYTKVVVGMIFSVLSWDDSIHCTVEFSDESICYLVFDATQLISSIWAFQNIWMPSIWTWMPFPLCIQHNLIRFPFMRNMIRFDWGDLGFEVFKVFSHYFHSASMIFSSFSGVFMSYSNQWLHRWTSRVGETFGRCRPVLVTKTTHQVPIGHGKDMSFRDFMGIWCLSAKVMCNQGRRNS